MAATQEEEGDLSCRDPLLGLTIGACTSAFRLIDGLLLRPLPVANPERLYSLFHESANIDGSLRIIDSYEYPLFLQMRAPVKDRAELIALFL